MTVEATISGRRYLESRRTTAVLSGSKDRDVAFTEQWDLVLTTKPGLPWRIVGRRGREEVRLATRIERAVARRLDRLVAAIWPKHFRQ